MSRYKTREELEKENERLKQTIKDLELELEISRHNKKAVENSFDILHARSVKLYEFLRKDDEYSEKDLNEIMRLEGE